MSIVSVSKLPDSFKLIPIQDLKRAPWNYKQENPELTQKLIANMRRNGQVENIVVRQLPKDKYEIVNGNHRLVALQALDIDEVVCFDLGKIKIVQAKRLAVELNETRFQSDPIRLAETVKEILESFDLDDLNSLPYTQDELAGFRDLLEYDWGEEDEVQFTTRKDFRVVFVFQSMIKANNFLKKQGIDDRLTKIKRRIEHTVDAEKNS